jgi:hypothetical protein
MDCTQSKGQNIESKIHKEQSSTWVVAASRKEDGPIAPEERDANFICFDFHKAFVVPGRRE